MATGHSGSDAESLTQTRAKDIAWHIGRIQRLTQAEVGEGRAVVVGVQVLEGEADDEVQRLYQAIREATSALGRAGLGGHRGFVSQRGQTDGLAVLREGSLGHAKALDDATGDLFGAPEDHAPRRGEAGAWADGRWRT